MKKKKRHVTVRRHRKPVRCASKACSETLDADHRPQTWQSPKFPSSYGWLFSVLQGRQIARPHRT